MKPLAWAALSAVPWSLIFYGIWKWLHGTGKSEAEANLARRIRSDEYLQSAHRDLPEPIGRKRIPVEEGRRSTALSRVGLR